MNLVRLPDDLEKNVAWEGEIGVRVLGFLRPGPRKILAFGALAFICVAGAVQTYAFIDDVPGIEKPPLYNQLRPFDFWLPWIIFTAPFHVPLSIICGMFDLCSPLFSHFPRLGEVRFPVVSVIYSYIAASWLVHSWNKWVSGSASTTRRLLLLIPLMAAGIMAGPTLFSMLLRPGEATFSISTLILTYAVLAFYSISGYGLYKTASELKAQVRDI